MPSFTSMSVDVKEAENFPHDRVAPEEIRVLRMMETLNRPLVGGFGATKVQHEQEVLLHPSANMQIEKVVWQNSGWLICAKDLALCEVSAVAAERAAAKTL